jgi:hypothetical protein
MPLIGYTCPPAGVEPGRTNAVEHCLTECVQPCTTPPLLAAMYKADVENYHQGDYISASMMAGSGCARQVMFERFKDFHEVPTRRYWAFRGTHAHAIVEGAQDLIAQYGWLQEIRMATELTYDLPQPVFENGVWTGDFDSTQDLIIKVRGTCDAYNPLRGPDLVDCKSMADKKVDMMIKGSTPGTYSKNLQDSWVAQLNIYRYLISKTPVPAEVHAAYASFGLPALTDPLFPAPERLFIQGIAMMSHPVSGSRLAHKQYGKYTIYDIDHVPVWSLQDIEDFIRPQALMWYKALNMKQTPPVVPKDKDWLCRSCAFEGKDCFPADERGQEAPFPGP